MCIYREEMILKRRNLEFLLWRNRIGGITLGHRLSPLAQWVKDLALLQLWCRSQLQLGSDP